MATKPKAKPAPFKPRNVITVLLRDKDENPDVASARELTRPAVQAAVTIQRMGRENYEINALANELQKQVAAVNGGDLARPEAMLIAQAHTLDAIFNSLARRAREQEHLLQYETHFRLALKAQSQCRATLETLAAIKNPPIIYAKQANIAHGPQQVNNGIPAPSQAGKNVFEQSKQSGGSNELLPDTRTPALAGAANPAMETLGEIDRAKDDSRQG